MAREPSGTAEESAVVADQRAKPALPPDAGRDDAEQTGNGRAAQGREGDGLPAGPVAPTAETAPTSPDIPVQAPGAPSAPAARERAEPGAATPQHHKIRHTRLSSTWSAVTGFGLVLLLLLIFILQNQNAVEVSYFGAHGHLPLGAALLLAAVAGILLVALAGSARIMQLRATARRHRRADKKAAEARR
jgi:uncharacterized integral membrane protein